MNTVVSVASLASAAVVSSPALAYAGMDDPIFAAIARCRYAEEAFNAHCEKEDAATTEESRVECEREAELAPDLVTERAALARTVPATPAGVAALASFVREMSDKYGKFYFEDWEESRSRENEQMTYTRSLDAAMRSMVGLFPSAPVAPTRYLSDDPIFVAIERHRRTTLAWLRQVDIENDLLKLIPRERRQEYRDPNHDNPEIGKGDDPRWTAARRGYWGAAEEMDVAAISLVETVPTSLAGIAALLDHIDDFARGGVKTSNTNYSSLDILPEDLMDGNLGEEHSFEFWIIRNIRQATVRLGAAEPPRILPRWIDRGDQRDDPVFSAIKSHREAAAAWEAHIADENNPERDEELCAADTAALESLLRSKPSTAAGMCAVLRYVEDYGNRHRMGLFSDFLNGPADGIGDAGAAFLSNIAAAIEAIARGRMAL